MNGSGEQFHPLPERIPGYEFHALDLRGQGSDHIAARRGAALDFETQMLDIAAFIAALRKSYERRLVFLMGESMGSLLTAGYAGWSRQSGEAVHAARSRRERLCVSLWFDDSSPHTFACRSHASFP
jgi:predicted alpha/beta hydrolase